jgi:hypothetical protein
MRKYIKQLLIITFSGCLLCLLTNPAFAATPSLIAYGLTVSPAIQQINLTSNQKSATYQCLVTNNTKSTVNLAVTAQDFTAFNQLGGVGLISPNSPSGNHGLVGNLNIGVRQFTLTPGQSQQISISIVNAQNLTPGGHYAAVLIATVPGIAAKSGNQISTNQEVSSLLFVTTAGNIINSIKMEPLQLAGFNVNLPGSVNLVFNNTGNTQTAPSGLVTLTGPSGELARGQINVGSGLVLPGTSRVYTVPLKYEGRVQFPGVYSLHISYSAADSQSTFTVSRSFFYISKIYLIITGLIILIIIVWLLRLTTPVGKYIFRAKT